MRDKSLLVAVVLTCMAGLLSLFPSPASASTPSPTISRFSPTHGPVGTTVTISGTNLANATRVRFGRIEGTVIVDTSTEVQVRVPSGAITSLIRVTTPVGIATSAGKFVVNPPLAGVVSVVSANNTNCAVLTSGGVDCWGSDQFGQLGDGVFTSAHHGRALSVPVIGVGGSGTLGGVVSVTGDGIQRSASGFCALLTSGGVDCWGEGGGGDLGNGTTVSSAVPVQVLGVGGSGTLGGVTSLTSDGTGSYCALLGSHRVDCWGEGGGGLGNGSIANSAVPVQVLGVGGSGTLGGAASLTAGGYGYCAVLATGGVDCWGYGTYGELGDGVFYANSPSDGSDVPVQVLGIGGSTLGGVVGLADGGFGYCALLASGGVDCWGYGPYGELGDGSFYNCCEPQMSGSAVPVEVLGLDGSGTLGSVVSLTGGGGGYCALLDSGGVDCWGDGPFGELGDGVFEDSDVPVEVLGVGGSGTLGGVASLTSDGGGYCALLMSSGVDCWGEGPLGELGDGIFYTTGNAGSAVPVQVLGVGASGNLGSVTSLDDYTQGFCSLFTSGGVDCWGAGMHGQLGNGVFYTNGENHGSAVPVTVVTAVTS